MVRLPFTRRTASPFDRLLKPHLPRLLQLAYRLTQHQAAAEDLVQDTCLHFLPRLEQLESLDDPGGWLARCLYRRFVDLYRREQRNPVESTDEPPDPPCPRPGPEDEALRESTRDQLLAALNRLSPAARDLVIWHDIEGYTLESLSEVDGTPLGTLKARLHRARRRLREDLMQPSCVPARVEDGETP